MPNKLSRSAALTKHLLLDAISQLEITQKETTKLTQRTSLTAAGRLIDQARHELEEVLVGFGK